MEPLARDASHWVELRPRLTSGLIVLAIVAVATLAGGVWFNALILFAALQIIREWDKLSEEFGSGWRLVGLAYAIIPSLSLIWLRDVQFIPYSLPVEAGDVAAVAASSNDGLLLVLFLVAVVSATDIGAFFAGRHIGGPRLAPSISPNKTWAGLLGGMLAAAVVSAVFSSFANFPKEALPALAIGLIMAVVAQAGDLFESWMKRKAGVKDSGTLIPGHGGIMDRLDGYILTAPLLVLFVHLFGAALA